MGGGGLVENNEHCLFLNGKIKRGRKVFNCELRILKIQHK